VKGGLRDRNEHHGGGITRQERGRTSRGEADLLVLGPSYERGMDWGNKSSGGRGKVTTRCSLFTHLGASNN